MKDLKQLKYFLGIEVSRSKIEICLSQQKYVLDLLVETKMLACKLVDTPVEKESQTETSRKSDVSRQRMLSTVS